MGNMNKKFSCKNTTSNLEWKNNYFIRSPFFGFNWTDCIVQEEIVESNLSKPNPFPTQLHWVVLYHFLLYCYSHIQNNKRAIIVVAVDSTSMGEEDFLDKIFNIPSRDEWFWSSAWDDRYGKNVIIRLSTIISSCNVNLFFGDNLSEILDPCL